MKNIMGTKNDPILAFLRIVLGVVFFAHGAQKMLGWFGGYGYTGTMGYFASLGIPFPHAEAILAGCVECFGGLLLLVGLATRLVSIPLMILLTVAYLTADFDRARVIFSDPDKFVTADEFLFLFAVVIVFVCGPGVFSLDAWIGRSLVKRSGKSEP